MSSIRKLSVIATGIVALGAASMAFSAGIAGKLLEQARERDADREQPRSQPAPAAEQPAPRNQPPPAAAPTQAGRGVLGEMISRNSGNGAAGRDRGNDRGDSQRRPPVVAAPPPPVAPPGNAGAAPANRGSNSRNDNARGNDRGVLGELLARNQRGGDSGGSRGDNHDDRGDHRGDRDDRGGYSGGGHNRPPRIVPSLPRGYRNYNWNGRPYYTYGGAWYQPYGSSYVAIGAPYGLFVSTLPGYSSSFYYGDTRYYYYDDTYYTYEPVRRGYVVARSPYGEDEDDYYDDELVDEDLYVYPAQGQSEQQQADDRYDCHRWAVDQAHYNPLDDEYDRSKRASYLRAMTACLTGRGYSVR